MPFRFLEHTADVQVECSAATFAGLLETAAEALYAIALERKRNAQDVIRRVAVEGECRAREETLIRWLQELLFLLDTERFVAVRAEFHRVSDGAIEATLRGYACAPEERAEEIKSTTYHELAIRETDDGFVARVIFDL